MHFTKPGDGSPGVFFLNVSVKTERDDPSFSHEGLAKLRGPDGGWAEGALEEFWGGAFSDSNIAGEAFSHAGRPAGQTSLRVFASGSSTCTEMRLVLYGDAVIQMLCQDRPGDGPDKDANHESALREVCEPFFDSLSFGGRSLPKS
ncbi:MAG: hypothetical protein LBQ12_00960 [Deltaproteobacteria bacterium]|nr:hypothetical protein [Deltaproteobacteria bacterium]